MILYKPTAVFYSLELVPLRVVKWYRRSNTVADYVPDKFDKIVQAVHDYMAECEYQRLEFINAKWGIFWRARPYQDLNQHDQEYGER